MIRLFSSIYMSFRHPFDRDERGDNHKIYLLYLLSLIDVHDLSLVSLRSWLINENEMYDYDFEF